MKFEERLQKAHAQYMKLWWETEIEFPPLGNPYTPQDQLANEREVDHLVNECKKDFHSLPKTGIPDVFPDKKIQAVFNKFQNSRLKTIVSHHDLAEQLINPFAKMADDFVTLAYQFDPNLKPSDIRQALRNLWTAGSLQLLLKQTPYSSPAIFAYSMLYPYTDNYLDDPAIPLPIKKELNQKFSIRLAGGAFPCVNSYERALDQLVGLIENQFPRLQYPDVYRSLLAIHQAQIASLLSQLQPTAPYERDILGISFQKGGCSVLADGYLVNGDLTEAEASFCFGYGAFLQLVDDLRDAQKDSQNGQMSIFSQVARKWPLDRLTNRTIHFSRKILKLLEPLEIELNNAPLEEATPQSVEMPLPETAPHSEGATQVLKELIQNSVTFLILEAISRNQNLYSTNYLTQIKEHTPFRLPYFRKLKAKFAKIESQIPGAPFLRFALISRIMSQSPGSIP
ncbi:MAG TPA: hypothetical protein VHY08_19580 [Bacillota bacterium]|nr:hypothetical protein [Bacillota bacterium]